MGYQTRVPCVIKCNFFCRNGRPEERAKKAHAAGLPPSAAAQAAAEALQREKAPAELQITVAVLGHQGRNRGKDDYSIMGYYG